MVFWETFCFTKIYGSKGSTRIHPGRLTAGTYKSPMKRKENDLPNHHFSGSMLIFQGVASPSLGSFGF